MVLFVGVIQTEFRESPQNSDIFTLPYKFQEQSLCLCVVQPIRSQNRSIRWSSAEWSWKQNCSDADLT